MTVSAVLDSAGRRRSPATMPGFHAGRPPRNKGMRYPADPPTVEEIIAVMRHAGDSRHGWRLRALIVVLWRGELRVKEALALAERDLDPRRGYVLVREGKAAGGARDRDGRLGLGAAAALAHRSPRSACRAAVLHHRRSDRGRPWSSAAVRVELRRLATQARVRRRFAPHQLRHAHALELELELAREGVPLNIIQLGTTSIYLQGIDTEEIIAAVHTRRAPMMSATAGLRL
jgi:integrase